MQLSPICESIFLPCRSRIVQSVSLVQYFIKFDIFHEHTFKFFDVFWLFCSITQFVQLRNAKWQKKLICSENNQYDLVRTSRVANKFITYFHVIWEILWKMPFHHVIEKRKFILSLINRRNKKKKDQRIVVGPS